MENLVGKGENVGYQHFPLFQQGFHMIIIKGSFQLGIFWKGRKYCWKRKFSFLPESLQQFMETDFCKRINPLPDEKSLDWFKLKEIAYDILKCIKSEN